MRPVRGLAVAFVLFALSFALHIVGGRLDQGWLFALAVGLIYVFATGFATVAWIAAGAQAGDRATIAVGAVAALALTMSALWAANDRSFAWWQWPLAPVLVAASSAVLYGAWRGLRPLRLIGRGASEPL
jgi:hypothetical protein